MSSEIAEAPVDNPTPKQRRSVSPVWQVLSALASLRLTVVLFVLSMFLVFVGTLAQMNEGVWTVVEKYFRSFMVWVPFQLFVQLALVFQPAKILSPDLKISGSFPFPAGWTLGTLLLLNLIAAHLTRFKFTYRRLGVLILHAGLIALMIGELVTGLSAIEARITMAEGETCNFTDESRKVELAIIDTSDAKSDDVVTVPGSMLQAKVGSVIRNDNLPVDIRVDEFADNSDIADPKDANGPDVVTSSVGMKVRLVRRSEGTGVDSGAHDDAPLAKVTLLQKGTDKEIGTFVTSLWLYPNFTSRLPRFSFPPQTFQLNDKRYTIELRPKREYKPYSLNLIEFRHDVYVGTNTPKNYSSLVHLTDPSEKEDREVLIRMNAPLRYRGETFYQSGVLQGKKGTILQVVRNPGWTLPYISCALVTLGMMVHFGMTLVGFLSRRMSA